MSNDWTLSVQISFSWTSKEIRFLVLSNTPYQDILNWSQTDTWTYYVVGNVIEREIERENVQMKPPINEFSFLPAVAYMIIQKGFVPNMAADLGGS